MSLEALLDRLAQAGLDPDGPQMLDALWLATQLPRGRRRNQGAEARLSGAQPGKATTGSAVLPAQKAQFVMDGSPSILRSESLRDNELFDNAFGRGAGATAASAVQVRGAAPPVDRLGLTRALRPYRTPWRKSGRMVLDEDATAEAVARHALAGSELVTPILRPRPERWFDVELIVENDAAIELWRDEQHAFVAAIRATGAFRRLRRWTLDLSGHASLISPAGMRLRVRALGNHRSLILVLTHGVSPDWRCGTLDAVLADWARRAPTALIQLLPQGWWARTALGDPDAAAVSDEPGLATAENRIYPAWWHGALASDASAIPLLPFEPAAIGSWARMVMTRGLAVPARLLQLIPEADEEGLEAVDDGIERRLGGLRESEPQAFELAVALSTLPFTMAAARIVQEAQLGTRETRPLAALFLSGLIEPVTEAMGEAGSWFQIRKPAAQLLQRSLQGSDRRRIADALIASVSAHIANTTGRVPSITNFLANPDGKFSLPDWAQPYARLAAGLRRPEQRLQSTERRLAGIREQAPRRLLGRLMRDVGQEVPVTRERHPELWDLLLDAGLLLPTVAGDRALDAEAAAILERWDADNPLWGMRVLWVDDAPTNNKPFRPILLSEGADLTEVTDTREALAEDLKAYDVILSDMARHEGEREGLHLLDRLRRRKRVPPVIIFAGGYASARANREEARRHGAFACTNQFEVVRDHILKIARAHEPIPFGRPSADDRAIESEPIKSFALDDFALVLDLGEGIETEAAAGAWAFATMLREACGLRADRIEQKSPRGREIHDILQSALTRSLARDKPLGTCFLYVCGGFANDWRNKIDLQLRRLIEELSYTLAIKQLVVIADLGPNITPDALRQTSELLYAPRGPRRIAQLIATAHTRASISPWPTRPSKRSPGDDHTTAIPRFTREVVRIFEDHARRGITLNGKAFERALERSLNWSEVGVETRSDSGFELPLPHWPELRSVIRPWQERRQEALDRADAPHEALRLVEAARLTAPADLNQAATDELLVIEAALLCRLERYDDAAALLLRAETPWRGTKFSSDATYYLALTATALGDYDRALQLLAERRRDAVLRAAVRSRAASVFAPLAGMPAFNEYLGQADEKAAWRSVETASLRLAVYQQDLSEENDGKLRALIASYRATRGAQRQARILLECDPGAFDSIYLGPYSNQRMTLRQRAIELGLDEDAWIDRATYPTRTIEGNDLEYFHINLSLQEGPRSILLSEQRTSLMR